MKNLNTVFIYVLGTSALLVACSTPSGTRLPAGTDKLVRTANFPGTTGEVPVFVRGGDAQSFSGKAATDLVPDTESYDAVVVGAGLSGLSAAVYLSEADQGKRRVLVLEKEDHFGGLAAAADEDGLQYDRGAAYWTSAFREEFEIVKHIGLGKFMTEQKIPEPIDSYFWKEHFYPGIWDESLKNLPSSFALFKEEITLEGKENLIPNQPFEDYAQYGGKMDLDGKTAAQWINEMPCRAAARDRHNTRMLPLVAAFNAEFGAFHCTGTDKKNNWAQDTRMKDVVDLMDLYCRSALGTVASEVSAMAFANFYISETVPRYTTEIGTGKAAENMRKMLEQRPNVKLISGATVLKMQMLKPVKTAPSQSKNEMVEVSYNLKNSAGKIQTHSVHAAYAVYSAQLKFAPEIISDLANESPEQAKFMRDLGYAHYSVHNVRVDGHPYRATYDTWTRASDYNGQKDFTDIILGRWVELKGYEAYRDFSANPPGDAILSIYHPLPGEWMGKAYNDAQAADLAVGATQRMLDLYTPLARELAPKRLANDINFKVKSIITSRWPYSVHIAAPGHFTRAKVLRKAFHHIYFANNNLGTPAFEEALFRGHCAAINIMSQLDKDFLQKDWSRCYNPTDHARKVALGLGKEK